MKNQTYLNGLLLIIFVSLAISCGKEDEEQQETWEIEVEQVRNATSQYTNHETATTNGLIDVSGYVPNMGHHYLNPALADGTFELEKPEIILYVPDENGVMEMVAVEYAIIPADPDNPGTPPEGFTGAQDQWHFNEMVGQWQLHVWTIMDNPDGIFATFNPDIGD